MRLVTEAGRWLAQATQPRDRWVMGATALALGWSLTSPFVQPPSQVEVVVDNRLSQTLRLDSPTRVTVAGRLGPVTVEVADRQARLLEQDSPRLIGVRTGWIGRTGQVAACVPCGVVLQVTGGPQPAEFDAMTR